MREVSVEIAFLKNVLPSTIISFTFMPSISTLPLL